LEVYALHLSRDLAYIVGVDPINSTVCNTFHQVLSLQLNGATADCHHVVAVSPGLPIEGKGHFGIKYTECFPAK
jgi:hypothetical protein